MSSIAGLTALESQLVDALLAGDDPAVRCLRQQCHGGSVESRDFTGVGFFTNFSMPEDAPRTDPRNFEIGDMLIEVEGLENGAMPILFVRDGLIAFLEVVTIDGPWPDNPKLLAIRRGTARAS